MPILYILCGPSGSGKTTWAKNYIIDNNKEEIYYVSRDEIRFKLLKDDEPYFSHEKEVFKKFGNDIKNALFDGFNVIADATHLNKFSRKKLTNYLDKYINNYKIIYVVFKTIVENCISNNSLRKNIEKVPEQVIYDMFNNFFPPNYNEDERIIDIITIGENYDQK